MFFFLKEKQEHKRSKNYCIVGMNQDAQFSAPWSSVAMSNIEHNPRSLSILEATVYMSALLTNPHLETKLEYLKLYLQWFEEYASRDNLLAMGDSVRKRFVCGVFDLWLAELNEVQRVADTRVVRSYIQTLHRLKYVLYTYTVEAHTLTVCLVNQEMPLWHALQDALCQWFSFGSLSALFEFLFKFNESVCNGSRLTSWFLPCTCRSILYLCALGVDVQYFTHGQSPSFVDCLGEVSVAFVRTEPKAYEELYSLMAKTRKFLLSDAITCYSAEQTSEEESLVPDLNSSQKVELSLQKVDPSPPSQLSLGLDSSDSKLNRPVPDVPDVLIDPKSKNAKRRRRKKKVQDQKHEQKHEQKHDVVSVPDQIIPSLSA